MGPDVFVQLGPDLGRRPPDQQPDGRARIAQGEGKKPCPPVAARVRVADHRAAAIINLALLAGGRRDDHARLDGSTPTQAPHEAADTRIAGRTTVVADQVLVEGDGVAPRGQGGLDALAERLAGAGRRRPARWNGVGRYRPRGGRVCCGRVGGHLPGNGRFCRLCRRPPWAADRQPRRLQIGADRLAAAPGRLFDAPERPSQAPKRQDLLSLRVAQDVAHPGEGPCRPCRRQRLSRGPLMAGFQVSINGRFWVSPETRAVNWSITISIKRIWAALRLRLESNSENAACAAARSIPTMHRTKYGSEVASLRARRPFNNTRPSFSPISTSVVSSPSRSVSVSGWLVRRRWITRWSRCCCR